MQVQDLHTRLGKEKFINGINKNHEYYPFMCCNICMKGGIIYEKFGFAWTEIWKIESH